MGHLFRHKLRDYFLFIKRDRNGILVLMVLNVIFIAGSVIIKNIEFLPSTIDQEMTENIKLFEERQQVKKVSSVFFYFNPNKVDALQLDSFPLPDFVKRNIISYRKAGGKYNNSSDLLRIYGMNDSIFNLLEPWLVFPENVQKFQELKQHDGIKTSEGKFVQETGSGDYLSEEHITVTAMPQWDVEQVYAPGICVELNSADSVDLVSLKGIGPVFASRIIKYRKLLGGFYSSHQLLEVYGFPVETYEKLERSFTVDTIMIDKLRLNFAEYSDLIRHPYLEKAHVVSILNFREKNGPYSSSGEILENKLLDSITYRKVEPYFTCR